MTGPYLKPLPRIDDTNRPHWEGARSGALRVQQADNYSELWVWSRDDATVIDKAPVAHEEA